MRCDYTIVQLPFTILVTIHLLSIQHNYFLNYLGKKTVIPAEIFQDP